MASRWKLTLTAFASGIAAALAIVNARIGQPWTATACGVLAVAFLALHASATSRVVLPPGMTVTRDDGVTVVRCPQHRVVSMHNHDTSPTTEEARP